MKRIVFTGGGTAGHVTPNIALFPRLKELGYDIQYIGSYDGIEKKLIADYGIPYYGIATGKLRRYFDPKNFSDPFRVLKGFAGVLNTKCINNQISGDHNGYRYEHQCCIINLHQCIFTFETQLRQSKSRH